MLSAMLSFYMPSHIRESAWNYNEHIDIEIYIDNKDNKHFKCRIKSLRNIIK